MAMQQVSERGAVAMMGHEGIVPGPYLCSQKVWTWGVGHTASAGAPDPARMPRGQARDIGAEIAHAAIVFREDLEAYAAEVRRAVKVPLAQHEFDALVSFHYNTGGIFEARATRLLNAGRRVEAGHALMGWAKNTELLKRRRAERDLFLHGTYPAGRVPVWGVTPSGRVVWKPILTLSPEEALRLVKLGAPEPAASAAPAASPRPKARPAGRGVLAALRGLFR